MMHLPLKADPRSRGGAGTERAPATPSEGRSPLARGSPHLLDELRVEDGPIPARAGEPPATRRPATTRRADPRSRGGAMSMPCGVTPTTGRSPLARGSQRVDVLVLAQVGPIPARAGEPAGRRSRRARGGADPRSRGGACEIEGDEAIVQGRSPLARGSRRQGAHDRAEGGPIPARAGEPTCLRWEIIFFRADPRSRGGAWPGIRALMATRGRSPLARGSQGASRRRGDQVGPIPARAGEPWARGAVSRIREADPRSRGGAGVTGPATQWVQGRSPLARGSRGQIVVAWGGSGPIPARAGEPSQGSGTSPRAQADPRSRGGAAPRSCSRIARSGRSPLARGSHADPAPHPREQGPIPARAGEPQRSRSSR